MQTVYPRMLWGTLFCLWLAGWAWAGESSLENQEASHVFASELIAYPGPWAFGLGKQAIILVSDNDLEMLADPDRVLDLSLTFDKYEDSLRGICEKAQARGDQTLVLAFDHFFSQYRPGQDTQRRLMPDQDEYVQRIAAISQFCEGYGLGLELSLLNPLEIGPAFRAQTGQSGVWMHYRKGLLDPQTGAFSVQLWQQQSWANNKGPLSLEDAGVRVFAFREEPLRGTPYSVVAPDSIVEMTTGVQVQAYEGLTTEVGDYRARRVRVWSDGAPVTGQSNRVLAVQQYRSPEMDYFSPKALPFLKAMIDKYIQAGVRINNLYSDEMHIQQDWFYYNHHDNGEFALRYVSPGLCQSFANQYGPQYEDFAKYLVYFVHGQEDTGNTVQAKEGRMHVMGASPQEVRATALLRARYYRMLQDGVTGLCVEAKHYAEQGLGHPLEARGHATWAQSPTIDYWETGPGRMALHQYEYTSSFVWSNTVHQASAACYDYFKWGEYLTGGGNDHAEGGWLDRNYYGLALACSLGSINPQARYAYAAHWGSPGPVSQRHIALEHAFGAAYFPNQFSAVQGAEHRETPVLMLYPMNLVAVDERVGSWMNQYGYANLISQEKLLELGQVDEAAVRVCGRRYTTLAVLFEPFVQPGVLDMLGRFAQQGGRVIWSGPPPVLNFQGEDVLAEWTDLFGVDYTPLPTEGHGVPGQQVHFEGPLASVTPQVILTDLLVDHVYPVQARAGVQVAGRLQGQVVATQRVLDQGGSLTFLGLRPRDDQSASLGYEPRQWFEILSALGAYPSSGVFPGVNDNAAVVSRTGPYFAASFPNGALSVAVHYKDIVEAWPGGFARDRETDEKLMQSITLPSPVLSLKDFKLEGHTITYEGELCMTLRLNAESALQAFSGQACRGVQVDGRAYTFCDEPRAEVAWAPVPTERQVPGGATMMIRVAGPGSIRIPALGLPDPFEVVAEGPRPGSRGERVSARLDGETLELEVSPPFSGRWLYLVPAQQATSDQSSQIQTGH